MAEIPTIILSHLREADELALRIADNAIVEQGEWSIELLAKNLDTIATLDLTIQPLELGFETAEYDRFRLGQTLPTTAEPVPLPDESRPATARVGDVIKIGPHTIVCGDAREEEVYRRAFGRRRAAAVISDQPWNLDINFISGGGKTKFRNFAAASGEMTPDEFRAFTEEVLEH